MNTILDRLRKRRTYPIDIEGETVFIRSLNRSERRDFHPFQDDEESFGFVLGCGLVNQDGEPLFERAENEDAKAFGARVDIESGLPDDTRSQICGAIARLSEGPTPEQLKASRKLTNQEN